MAFDIDKYTAWAKRRVYLMIFEFILEDFMPRDDCQAIHSDGNMLAGDATVTHLTARGGQNTYGSAKKSQYRQELERGDSTLSSARETGETGALRR